jgi:hypothetical protein
MWPNALVLDALLRMGYEGEARVQTVLQTLTSQEWCECGYQNGVRAEGGPYRGGRLDGYEAQCIKEYRFGRLGDPEELLRRDLAHPPIRYQRVAHRSTRQGHRYDLQPDLHIQGCEFITTWALSSVQDPDARRFAAAHIWRFAGSQLPDGTFPRERHGTGFTPLGLLGVFARYPDHPASRVVLLRALPGVIEAQHPDGSWQESIGIGRSQAERSDAATRAVVEAMVALGDDAPSGVRRSLGT